MCIHVPFPLLSLLNMKEQVLAKHPHRPSALQSHCSHPLGDFELLIISMSQKTNVFLLVPSPQIADMPKPHIPL